MNHKSWDDGIDAYFNKEPFSLDESPEWRGGYKWAEQTYGRDLKWVGFGIIVAAALMTAGAIGLAVAWWLA